MPVYTQVATPSGRGFAGRLTSARYCPKRASGDDYRGAFMWYSMPTFPDFNICTYCYNTHVKNAPPSFANEFAAQEDDGFEVIKTCDFHFPQPVQTWYNATNASNFAEFTNYLQRFSTTAQCPGTTGSTPQPNLRWMTLTSNRIQPGGPDSVDGFVVCERCYTAIASATPFSNRFEPFRRAQGPQESWTCDLALPSIEHAFSQAAGPGGTQVPWHDILNAIRARFVVEKCTGASGSAAPRRWWTVRPEDSKSIERFMVCDEHFHDDIIPSGRSREFIPVLHPQAPGELRICDFTTHSIKIAWLIVVNLAMHSAYWRDGVAATFHAPKCTTDGVRDGTFFALQSPSGEPLENTGFCAACYYSYLRTYGPDFERYFVQRTDIVPGTSRVCDLCIGLARAPAYIRKLMKAGVTGDFRVFAEHVAVHAPMPICPTNTAVMDNRKWYGMDGLLICEECHWDVIRPSSFPYPVSLTNSFCLIMFIQGDCLTHELLQYRSPYGLRR